MDKLNEKVAGNVLLSTESGTVRKDKFDVPVQMKQLWADYVIMKDKKKDFVDISDLLHDVNSHSTLDELDQQHD